MESQVIISPLDKRTYKVITLENQLECVLISDPLTQKSSAALMVKVGMLDDPRDTQGLAHFLEHMLFMGSAKYPSQNDFSAYISMNAGETNASTSLDGTKYYFEVASQGFMESLDRWGQFFVAPLFDDSCVEREMNAVESEFQLSLNEDDCRVWEYRYIYNNYFIRVFRQHANIDSTLNKFGCGNLKTLQKSNINQCLTDFYRTYYSANLMKLSVYSNHTITELEECVQKIFSEVPNKGAIIPIHIDNPFDGRGGVIHKIISVKDENVLYITWLIPSQRKNYKKKADEYITHLLGYEGKHSLTSFLNDEGLITSLSASSNEFNDAWQSIEIEVCLTEDGYSKWEHILAYIYQFIDIIKLKGIQPYLYDELRLISDISFRFKENSSRITSYIMSLAKSLNHYPQQDIVVANYLYEDYDAPLIASLLDHLTPNNMILVLRSQKLSEEKDITWLSEQYHGTKYCTQPLHANTDLDLTPQHTTKKLDVPEKNQYIPQTFDLKSRAPSVTQYPEIIMQDGFSDVWFLQDSTFDVCKSAIYLNVYPRQEFVHLPQYRVMFELWLSVFGDTYIKEKCYEVECVNAQFDIKLTYNSLRIELNGFNDGLIRFFNDFLELFVKFHSHPKQEIKEHIFDMYYDDLQEHYDNHFLKSPYDLTFSYWKSTIYQQGKYDKQELIDALEKVTYQKFIKFSQELFSQTKLQWFISGNITKEEAIDLATQTNLQFAKLGTPQTLDQLKPLELFQLQSNDTLIRQFKIEDNPDETNSGVMIYYQGFSTSNKIQQMLFTLLGKFISDPVEDQLRTNEQLGYVAQSYTINRRGVMGLIICIVSSIKSPNELAIRIDSFLVGYLLKIITEEEFLNIKKAILQEKTQKYQNFTEQAQDYFHEIYLNTHDFDKKTKIESQLNQITLFQFQQFTQDLLINQNRLEVHILNSKHFEQDKPALLERQSTQSLKHIEKLNHLPTFKDLYHYV